MVLNTRGWKCNCCGETEPLFLELDHVNGDGGEHRRTVGTNLMVWIIKNKFPTTIQLLCSNCNKGRFINGGVCPHRKKEVLKGVVNVHGEIQICVSLKHLIGLEEHDKDKEKEQKLNDRMMVVNKDGDVWVFPVKEIHGIHHVHPDLFQNVPVTISKSKSTFTKEIFKWEDKHVALLDDELLFYSLKRSIQ